MAEGLTLFDKLKKTWPAEAVQSLWSAVQLPGDVYAGRADPMSDESIGRAADLAGAVTLGAGAVPSAGAELRSGFGDYLKHYRRAKDTEQMFRAGPVDFGNPEKAGVFFHSTRGGAQVYGDMTGEPVRKFRFQNMENPLVIDVDGDDAVKRLADQHSYEYQYLYDLADKLGADEGDPALTLEALLPKILARGKNDSVVVHGETGPDVGGLPEIVPFSSSQVIAPRGVSLNYVPRDPVRFLDGMTAEEYAKWAKDNL